jgi:hypothetical protein
MGVMINFKDYQSYVPDPSSSSQFSQLEIDITTRFFSADEENCDSASDRATPRKMAPACSAGGENRCQPLIPKR